MGGDEPTINDLLALWRANHGRVVFGTRIGDIASIVEAALAAAVKAENEECAKVAEGFRDPNPYPTIYRAIADAIRSRPWSGGR